MSEIERFEAITDKGDKYVIIYEEESLDNGTFGQPNSTKAGLKNYHTDNGLHVTRIDSETFQIIEDNVIVRKVT